jgi:hypothetical protein
MWAVVAGPRNPSNLPMIISFDPVRTAVSEPDPVTLAFIAASIATGASRALNVFGLCAAAIAMATAKVPRKYLARFTVKIRIYKYEAPVRL